MSKPPAVAPAPPAPQLVALAAVPPTASGGFKQPPPSLAVGVATPPPLAPPPPAAIQAPNEVERLRALRALQLIGKPPDSRFDAITA